MIIPIEYFISGDLGNKIFNGILKAEDSNLQLDFNGLVDFSQDIKKFDFKANVVMQP